MVFDKYRGLAFPFDEFWLENPVEGGGDSGCLVRRRDAATFDGHFVIANNHRPAFIMSATLQLGVDGGLNIESGGTIPIRPVRSVRSSVGDGRGVRLFLDGLFSNLLLLGCKNVGLKEAPVAAEQSRRAAKRFGGDASTYRYHTLVVRSPGAKRDAPSQDIGVVPHHVCRGHFAEYGPEFGKGLLFGQYAGRFYVPPHIKGDKKNGVVEKDYLLASASTPAPVSV